MITQLTQHQKETFSNILFNSNELLAKQSAEELQNPQEIIKLKKIYDQKIAFECAYNPIKPPKQINEEYSHQQAERPPIPSFIGTFCCCFYPQDNRDVFDITNEIFLKRFFAVFLFWRKNFLSVGGGKPDLYGPVWLVLGYVVLVGFMGNFALYMVDSLGFDFVEQHYANIFGTTFIFIISQMLFYPAILSCLGGFISTKDAVCILGYSIVLYYIPSMLCMFTSLAWYVTCLFGEGILRAIFLFRNFSTRIQARTYILLVVFLLVQFLYAYILLQIIFFKYSGYTYSDGINQLTGSATVMPVDAQMAPAHMMLRHFLD